MNLPKKFSWISADIWLWTFAGLMIFNFIGVVAFFYLYDRNVLADTPRVPPSEIAASSPSESSMFLQIAAGPPSESLFALAAAISGGISRPQGASPCDESGICGVPGLVAVAQSSSGVFDDLQMMRDGHVNSVLATADAVYMAYRGGGPFLNKPVFDQLNVIALLNPVLLHIIVRADSDISTLRDLAGRRLALGGEGSNRQRLVRKLLRVVGLEKGDYVEQNIMAGTALDALEAGTLDAVFELGSPPVPAIQALASRIDLKLIPLDQLTLRTMQSLYPYMKPLEIEAENYNKPKIPTLGIDTVWVVENSVSERLAYDLARSLWQGQARTIYQQTNPMAPLPDPLAIEEMTILPVHPGATRYYRREKLRLQQ